MIDIKQQEEVLIAIGDLIEKKMVVYAIGGTAMMLRNIKDTTLDVDLVFDKQDDRNRFTNALKKLGAKKSDTTLFYKPKDNVPIIISLLNARFDLFMNKIITSLFSENMKKRAGMIHEFGKNLIVKVADIHDIIIMKSVTSRAKDLDDIATLIKKNQISWDVIIEEAEDQVKLGNELAIISLGERFEKLNKLKEVTIPKPVLDRLWDLLNKGADKKRFF